jgi:formate-dependent phosphoribosylglycinamide formyltransferase (GAR transformylase)
VSPQWDVAHILMLGSSAVTAAAQSTACAVVDCLNMGIVGLNLTWSKKEFIFSEVTSCFKQAGGLNL